jgi:hypothetical protein
MLVYTDLLTGEFPPLPVNFPLCFRVGFGLDAWVSEQSCADTARLDPFNRRFQRAARDTSKKNSFCSLGWGGTTGSAAGSGCAAPICRGFDEILTLWLNRWHGVCRGCRRRAPLRLLPVQGDPERHFVGGGREGTSLVSSTYCWYAILFQQMY